MAEEHNRRTTETGRRLQRFIDLLQNRTPLDQLQQAARDLWSSPSYEQDLDDDRLRDPYIDALFSIAELSRNTPDYEVISPYGYNKPHLPGSIISSWTIDALKRAYTLDDGHIQPNRGSSAREAAAYKLGQIYEQAHCHHTAISWFKSSLRDARTAGVTENVLLNLRGLARNLNTVGNFADAGLCYDEMLQLLEHVVPADQVSSGLAHAAMYHLQHGDRARGESIMHTLAEDAFHGRSQYFRSALLPMWFGAALHGLGVHYATSGRAADAGALADDIIANANRFEKPDLVFAMAHGLAARAHIEQGNLDAALSELAHVYDVDTSEFVRYDTYVDPTTLDLWLDVARIHAARHRYALAFNAYRMLAYYLGGLIVDRNYGNTNRLRMHWLQRVVFIVHEMASVWLTIVDQDTRRATEPTVARALMQIKVNLFIALQKGKNPKTDFTREIFIANRKYAAAARRLAASPDSDDEMLALEAALFEREQFERVDLPFAENQLVPPREIAKLFGLVSPHESTPFQSQFSPFAGVAATAVGDFRHLVVSNTIFLDYSVISFQPPKEGRQGPLLGRRYLGIRVSEREYRILDVGNAAEIEAQCEALLAACSAPGPLSPERGHVKHATRHLVADDLQRASGDLQLDRLSADLYDRVVAPFEPLAKSLKISPDGILAAVPFHALLHDDHWLVEHADVTYCHSPHLVNALFLRQYNPETRLLPPASKVALLLGDPAYEGCALERLPGTALEIAEVTELLTAARFPDGGQVFDEVRCHTGADATPSRLLSTPLPRILHVAAHGGFLRAPAGARPERAMRFGEYYRAWDEMGVGTMTALDDGLLRCELVLSKEQNATADPACDAVLTALELSSLNLLHCHAVILSACETGTGVPLHGAGTLGFQYALLATCARAGVVSLWKVLDSETATFMTDFYQDLLHFNSRRIAPSFMAAMRQHCRRDHQRVHPYYWAAFMFIDAEYDNPVPW